MIGNLHIVFDLRPPEGLSRSPVDGRSDARREHGEASLPPRSDAPAVASGQSFESDILKLARAC